MNEMNESIKTVALEYLSSTSSIENIINARIKTVVIENLSSTRSIEEVRKSIKTLTTEYLCVKSSTK